MAARTTDAEEQELRRLLRSGDIPESLRDIAVLFEGFDALSEEQYPDERAGKRPDALAVSRELSRVEVHPLHRRNVWWGVAVAAALAVGIFVCAELLRKPYCYIDGQPSTTVKSPCRRRPTSTPLLRSTPRLRSWMN